MANLLFYVSQRVCETQKQRSAVFRVRMAISAAELIRGCYIAHGLQLKTSYHPARTLRRRRKS